MIFIFIDTIITPHSVSSGREKQLLCQIKHNQTGKVVGTRTFFSTKSLLFNSNIYRLQETRTSCVRGQMLI